MKETKLGIFNIFLVCVCVCHREDNLSGISVLPLRVLLLSLKVPYTILFIK